MSTNPTPGWYPAQDMVDTLRYWDGERWTDKVAPASLGGEVVLYIVGWVGAFLFPPLGVVVGIALARKGKKYAGLMIGFSVVLCLGWAFLIAGVFASPTLTFEQTPAEPM